MIQRYEELYTQARLEALDAIEAVQIKNSHQRCGATSTAAMDASDMFNVQLLLEVFKVCYTLQVSGILIEWDCVRTRGIVWVTL